MIPDTFINQLLILENEVSPSWKVLNADELDTVEQLSKWIQHNEEPSRQLILITSNINDKPEISLAMAEYADISFLILDNTLESLAPVTSIEKIVYESSLLNNIDLVILRKDNSVKITGTSKILNKRQIHLHHHLALNSLADFKRLQRFIAGTATGLVLCGGGAFGTAHLGMIKALQEHGYNFDILGRTSAGSAMAALYALGYSPDNALIELEEMFINKKSFRKYSIPFYSFIDHKNFDNELKRVATKIDIEDLPINYFAVATNITRNQLQVIRKGPLWEAVRSSCSIPGILPPYITEDGDVLIDGAVMDNTPVETLHSIKSGPNIVMNFSPLRAWKVNSDYSTTPRGLELLKQIVFPKRKNRKYYPTIFAILSRAMVTNTEKRFSEINQKSDIFLEPKRLGRMGMMNWKKSREQFDLSYKQMKSALANTEAETEHEKIIALRDIAQDMKKRKIPLDNG